MNVDNPAAEQPVPNHGAPNHGTPDRSPEPGFSTRRRAAAIAAAVVATAAIAAIAVVGIITLNSDSVDAPGRSATTLEESAPTSEPLPEPDPVIAADDLPINQAAPESEQPCQIGYVADLERAGSFVDSPASFWVGEGDLPAREEDDPPPISGADMVIRLTHESVDPRSEITGVFVPNVGTILASDIEDFDASDARGTFAAVRSEWGWLLDAAAQLDDIDRGSQWTDDQQKAFEVADEWAREFSGIRAGQQGLSDKEQNAYFTEQHIDSFSADAVATVQTADGTLCHMGVRTASPISTAQTDKLDLNRFQPWPGAELTEADPRLVPLLHVVRRFPEGDSALVAQQPIVGHISHTGEWFAADELTGDADSDSDAFATSVNEYVQLRAAEWDAAVPTSLTPLVETPTIDRTASQFVDFGPPYRYVMGLNDTTFGVLSSNDSQGFNEVRVFNGVDAFNKRSVDDAPSTEPTITRARNQVLDERAVIPVLSLSELSMTGVALSPDTDRAIFIPGSAIEGFDPDDEPSAIAAVSEQYSDLVAAIDAERLAQSVELTRMARNRSVYVSAITSEEGDAEVAEFIDSQGVNGATILTPEDARQELDAAIAELLNG